MYLFPKRRVAFRECKPIQTERRETMSSIYKVIELIGCSDKSWEDAAKKAVETAAKSLKEIRIAEIKELDMRVEKNKVVEYRAKLRVSFKYTPG
jgi:dodecin